MVETNGKRIWNAVKSTANVDAVIVTDETLKRYVSGFLTEGGFILIKEEGTTLFTDARYIEAAKKLFEGTEIKPVEMDRFSTPVEEAKRYKKLGLCLERTLVPEYERLKDACPDLVDVSEVFKNLRTVKNKSELQTIQKACEVAEDGFNKLLPEIKEGMTESEVAALLEYNMRLFGAYCPSFDTIVAFGPHAAVPHHVTGDTKLKFGDEILIDFGCKVDGYCSDITRTFLFGDDKKHDEFKKAYQAVLDAHEKVKAELKSGMTGGDGDKIARDYLESHGLGKYFTHSLGHGIGLEIHEYPSIRRLGQDVLKDGMVFSDEPGVYLEGEYGIRIEDSVCLENGSVKSFMKKTDRNLVIL